MMMVAVLLLLQFPLVMRGFGGPVRTKLFRLQTKPALRETPVQVRCKHTSAIPCAVTCASSPNCTTFCVGEQRIRILSDQLNGDKVSDASALNQKSKTVKKKEKISDTAGIKQKRESEQLKRDNLAGTRHNGETTYPVEDNTPVLNPKVSACRRKHNFIWLSGKCKQYKWRSSNIYGGKTMSFPCPLERLSKIIFKDLCFKRNDGITIFTRATGRYGFDVKIYRKHIALMENGVKNSKSMRYPKIPLQKKYDLTISTDNGVLNIAIGKYKDYFTVNNAKLLRFVDLMWTEDVSCVHYAKVLLKN